MTYTLTDKGNGYYSVHVDGMFCMTSSSREAVVEYIELMQAGNLEGLHLNHANDLQR